jgi:hypothetical protein
VWKRKAVCAAVAGVSSEINAGFFEGFLNPSQKWQFTSDCLTKTRHEARSSAEYVKTGIIVVFQHGIRLFIAKGMLLMRIRLNTHEFRPSIESAPHCRNFHGRGGIHDRIRCI